MRANLFNATLKSKNIVLENEIPFDYVKLYGFNGNTLCGEKNEV